MTPENSKTNPLPSHPSPSHPLPVAPSQPTIPVSETFVSLQGEGKLTGVPSYFIRVSGCNLRCVWCDTPYASWFPEGTSSSLEELITQALATPAKHIVLTGGEPMMFPQIETLANLCRNAGLHITIETAGTIFRKLPCNLMSISPKLSSSTPGTEHKPDPRDPTGAWRKRHEERRINIDALQQLIDHYPDHQLKFVITAESDLAEIDTLLARLARWSDNDILLMPEGIAPPSPALKQWLADQCVKRNWRYCPRLHIDIYGNRRGT